jgi:hypothetical protein
MYKSECMFVALLSGMFLGMYTINPLTDTNQIWDIN